MSRILRGLWAVNVTKWRIEEEYYAGLHYIKGDPNFPKK